MYLALLLAEFSAFHVSRRARASGAFEDLFRQVFDIDHRGRRLHHHRSIYYYILQLAHISWPGIAAQQPDRLGGKGGVLSGLAQKMFGEAINVFGSLSEGRHA